MRLNIVANRMLLSFLVLCVLMAIFLGPLIPVYVLWHIISPVSQFAMLVTVLLSLALYSVTLLFMTILAAAATSR